MPRSGVTTRGEVFQDRPYGINVELIELKLPKGPETSDDSTTDCRFRVQLNALSLVVIPDIGNNFLRMRFSVYTLQK